MAARMLNTGWRRPSAGIRWAVDASPQVSGSARRVGYDKGLERVDPIPMATVVQAYKFALDPSPAQRRALASHCGAARFAFNWGLARVRQRLDEHEHDPTIEVPWTLPALRREWKALKNWSDSRSGRRKGRPVGFPRAKEKGAVPRCV